MDDLRTRLTAPFKASDVEWRIARSGIKDGKPWGMCLAYITNRAIMDRLDEVVGPGAWRNEYQRWGDKGVLCGLSIRGGFEGLDVVHSWVTKWDGAEETDIESVKGGLSAAMKRAAVQWGIGRYLYDLEEGWAVFGSGPYSAKIDGSFYRWAPPALPKWALPEGEKQKGSATVREHLAEPPAPLSEMPAALQDDRGEPLEGQPLLDIYQLCFSAGIRKGGFGKWYESVLSHPFDGWVYPVDLPAIRAECAKLLAAKGKKSA